MERDSRLGNTWVRVMIGLLIIAGMIAISVPQVQRQRRETRREYVISTLGLIMAAKEQVAVQRGLGAGAPVTMQDLVTTSGTVLAEVPAWPPGVKAEDLNIGVIGELPTINFYGEKVSPLTDFRPLSTQGNPFQ